MHFIYVEFNLALFKYKKRNKVHILMWRYIKRFVTFSIKKKRMASIIYLHPSKFIQNHIFITSLYKGKDVFQFYLQYIGFVRNH